MEVKKENYLIRQEIFTFLNNRETLKTSLNFRNISVNIQSYLKKDDNIHIFFSKKLSDEFLFNLLGKENKQPVKRFNRKSKNPVYEEDIHKIIDLKFFNKENQNSAFQNLTKLENFEKTMQSNKFIQTKHEERSLNQKNTNCIYTNRQLNLNNYKILDEEEDINKKKRSDVTYSNYSNSIYGNRKKKMKSKEDDESYAQEEISFKPALEEIKKNNYKFEPPTAKNTNISNNINNSSNQSEEVEKKTTFKKFVPPIKNNNNNNCSSMTTNKQQTNSNKDEEIGNCYYGINLEPEMAKKFKSLDKKLLEFLESEVLDSAPSIEWNDIAGLEFAKKTIKEIIIWPMLRPELFKGIRRPPKVYIFNLILRDYYYLVLLEQVKL